MTMPTSHSDSSQSNGEDPHSSITPPNKPCLSNNGHNTFVKPNMPTPQQDTFSELTTTSIPVITDRVLSGLPSSEGFLSVPLSLEVSPNGPDCTVGTPWAKDFTPRLAVEAVRNCTHVELGIKETIIAKVTAALLEESNMIEIEMPEKAENAPHQGQEKVAVRFWNRGGQL